MIYVNGTLPTLAIYVLQLATPYYEELTVRENLTLAAEMKLPSSMEQEERFERVEQVMQVVCVVIIILGPYHACLASYPCRSLSYPPC